MASLGTGGMVVCAVLIILLPAGVAALGEDPTRGVVNGPTLSGGGSFRWSYFERSPDGATLRDGIMTASITEDEWNGQDVFRITGTITGEFETDASTGDETGEWGGYFRQSDLALLQSWKDVYYYIDGISQVTGNGSRSNYDIPYLRWVNFPLRTESPRTSWDEDVRSITTWTHTTDGTESDSGVADETFYYRRMCHSESNIAVQAGDFDIHLIKEWREVGGNRIDNTSTFYSEEIGWWVLKETYAPYNSDSVLISRYEMLEVGGNNPPVALPVPPVEMDEDTIKTGMDASLYFSDPESDLLDFDAVDTGQLTVTLNDNMVTIIPPGDGYGSFTFNLTASDNRHSPVKNMVTVVVNPVNDPPVPYGGEVDPPDGDTTELYTFQLTIMDVEGDIPSSVKVFVDGTEQVMTGQPGDITNGILYTWSSHLGEGIHEFYFRVDGIRSPVSGVFDGPEITSPVDARLFSPGLDIEAGGTDSPFEFSINWMDEQDRSPDDIYLIIDGDDYHSMMSDDASAKAGMKFKTIIFLPEGIHSYHFEGTLDGTEYRYPTNGALMGPEVFDPKIKDSGYWPEEPLDGDEVTFYVVYQYGHGITPDSQKLILDGEEYTLFVSDGDAIDGMNLTRRKDLDSGRHTYRFIIEVDGLVLSTLERSIEVSTISQDDDDIIDPSGDEKPATFVVVIIIAVLILVGVVAFFIVRYKPPEKPTGDFEEATASEGHVSNIRGL